MREKINILKNKMGNGLFYLSITTLRPHLFTRVWIELNWAIPFIKLVWASTLHSWPNLKCADPSIPKIMSDLGVICLELNRLNEAEWKIVEALSLFV